VKQQTTHKLVDDDIEGRVGRMESSRILYSREELNTLLTEPQAARKSALTTAGLRKMRRRGIGPKYLRLGNRAIRYKARLITWGKQLAKHEDHTIGDYRIVMSRMVQRAKLWRLLPLAPVATA
jgi:hypothetical protein